jgi:3-deoxy-D-manno-octulosonate 8-phosphate phosphatase (KDO 8-P phosphatase)
MEQKMKYKLFLTDCDGVMTDNRVIVDENGKESLIFNKSDAIGFRLLKDLGLSVAIISSENNKCVLERANKINVKCFHGVVDKLDFVNNKIDKNIKLSEIIYMGNDVNDYELLTNVGYPICPSDAASIIKHIKNIDILPCCGGDGCIRYFAEKFCSVHLMKDKKF